MRKIQTSQIAIRIQVDSYAINKFHDFPRNHIDMDAKFHKELSVDQKETFFRSKHATLWYLQDNRFIRIRLLYCLQIRSQIRHVIRENV